MSDAPTSPAPTRRHRVLVLGAGMSGICSGVKLLEAGIRDFAILEKADSVGGTWRENTYPGVACDVPSHVYSFSFELNPNWEHGYSSGAAIRDYLARTTEKYGVEPYLHFGREITKIAYEEDGEGSGWSVHTANGEIWRADSILSGLGGLHLPNRAAIEGIESFAGPRFHTAQWDHSVDLSGKRVAVIGTGASAAQVVPAVAPDVAKLSVFQRSAAWVFPRLTQEIPESRRETYRRHPWRMRLRRLFLWFLMDVLGVLSLRRGGLLAGRLKRMGLAHLDESVRDPETRRKLTPDYEPGCKRRVISDDYLSTFNEEHVELVTDGIERIEPGGVRDATGRLHEADVLVEATGFRPFDITDYVEIIGRKGLHLRDAWAERVEAHRTMMVPGFPNFFLLLGPNSATGHTSALIMIESQVKYAVRCLQWMEREGLATIDPDPAFVARYNQRLQRDMKKMVFSGGCNSWYTDSSDHNFSLWPYSALRYIVEQWRPRPDEFRRTS